MLFRSRQNAKILPKGTSPHSLQPSADEREAVSTHLLEIERTAQGRVETMLPHMMEAAGVTEELKVCDPMRWVGLMNTLKVQVEETIFQELIFQ